MSNQFEKMQQLLAGMRLNYLDELPEKINNLEIILLALEENPDNQEHYNELYRNIHSMKGSGGSYGIDILTNICHQMENFMQEIQGDGDIKQNVFANLFLCIDLLRDARSVAANSISDYSEIESRLNQLYQSAKNNKPAILIAETSPTLTSMYRQILSSLPVQITCINDGLPALEQLIRHPYNLIIAGKELKTLNAYALVAALRYSNSLNQKIPAIILSSSHEPPNNLFSMAIMRDKNQTENLLQAVCSQLKLKYSRA